MERCFDPFPVLETERLRLRRIAMDDADDMFAMRHDPRMHTYTDTKPDETIDDTRTYIGKMNAGVDAGKWIIWAMEHKVTGRVIGSISIWNLNEERQSGELGFGIVPSHQGQGLMREALQRVTGFGFQAMNLDILEAYTEQGNLPSLKLLERCGFSEVGRVDEEGTAGGRTYHMVIYRLTRSA
ncbi:MAG: GNAT family N-acetyltransferase [Bacillota bacterium]